jgi:squalene-hopene/tetraprenyl-beta-curcumene cyclase
MIEPIATGTKQIIFKQIISEGLSPQIQEALIGNIEKEPNPFYFCYASLFTETKNSVIDSLNIAGYYYYKYLLATDAMVDSRDAQHSYLNLVFSNFYHESSIRVLSNLFDVHSCFWSFWQKRKQEYLNAFVTDKKFLPSLPDTDFQDLADCKSSNGKSAIDALFALGYIGKTEYEILLQSHKLFSAGFQYYDDVLDLKQDLGNRQTNIALCELKIQLPEDEFKSCLSNPDRAVAKMYLSGVAKKILRKSIASFEEAESIIKDVDCSLWKEAILNE